MAENPFSFQPTIDAAAGKPLVPFTDPSPIASSSYGAIAPSTPTTPFDSSAQNIVTNTSSVKTKVNDLNKAISNFEATNSGPNDTTSADFILGKNTPITSTTPVPPVPPAPVNPPTTQDFSKIIPGTHMNGSAVGLDPSKEYIYQGNGTFATVDPKTGAYVNVTPNAPAASNSGSSSGSLAIPEAPTFGKYTPDQQARIDAAGNTAGAAFDPLINTAQNNKLQGLAKAEVSAGERGGFMNTQFAGLSAVLPTQGGTWEGQGGQLQYQQSVYDQQINQLQVQKANAISEAKFAMQQYLDTGSQQAYDNAVKSYSLAVESSRNEQSVAQQARTEKRQAEQDAFTMQQALAKPALESSQKVQEYVLKLAEKYVDAFAGLSSDQFNKLSLGQAADLVKNNSVIYRNERAAESKKLTGSNSSGVTLNADGTLAGGTGNPVLDIAGIIKNSKVGATTKTNLANVLNVIEGATNWAKDTGGDFGGFYPGSRAVDFALPEFLKSKEKTVNQATLAALNLKVQQWASGASLTKDQTEQVNQLLPKQTDSDNKARTKLNTLANYMVGQAKGNLASEGVYVDFPKVDLFEKKDAPAASTTNKEYNLNGKVYTLGADGLYYEK